MKSETAVMIVACISLGLIAYGLATQWDLARKVEDHGHQIDALSAEMQKKRSMPVAPQQASIKRRLFDLAARTLAVGVAHHL